MHCCSSAVRLFPEKKVAPEKKGETFFSTESRKPKICFSPLRHRSRNGKWEGGAATEYYAIVVCKKPLFYFLEEKWSEKRSSLFNSFEFAFHPPPPSPFLQRREEEAEKTGETSNSERCNKVHQTVRCILRKIHFLYEKLFFESCFCNPIPGVTVLRTKNNEFLLFTTLISPHFFRGKWSRGAKKRDFFLFFTCEERPLRGLEGREEGRGEGDLDSIFQGRLRKRAVGGWVQLGGKAWDPHRLKQWQIFLKKLQTVNVKEF